MSAHSNEAEPRDAWSHFATRSALLATWVEVIGLVAAGLFAVVQYLAHTENARVEKTIDFLKSWSAEPIAGCYAKISSVWNDKSVQTNFLHLVEQTRDDEHAMRADRPLGRFVLETIERYQLEQPIYRLNEFYATISACVDRNVCDRSLAAAFFCSDASSFEERTLALTLVKREGDPDYAIGLRKLLETCRRPRT